MIRGTTPTLEFTLPFDTASIAELFVTFVQNSRVIAERSLEECEAEGRTVKVHFTQADTLSFAPGRQVEMQIRVKFDDGAAVASEIITTSVDRTLKDGAI